MRNIPQQNIDEISLRKILSNSRRTTEISPPLFPPPPPAPLLDGEAAPKLRPRPPLFFLGRGARMVMRMAAPEKSTIYGLNTRT